MFIKFLIFIILSFSHISYGQVQQFLAKDIESIQIQAVKIKIIFEYKSSKNIQVQWNASSSVKNKSKVLEIKDSSYNEELSWKDSFISSKKETVLKITGPSRPTSVFTVHSKIILNGWKSHSLFVSSKKTRITGEDNELDLNVFSKKGELEFTKYKGSVNFKGLHMIAKLDEISDTKSHFYFNEGSLRLKQVLGDVFFTTDKGRVSVRQFEGQLVGTSQSGQVGGSMKPKSSVDAYSKQGDLRFGFAKATGARFFAFTEKGKIYAPAHMHKEYSGKSLKVRGRMKGNEREGNISLKTNSGSIYAY